MNRKFEYWLKHKVQSNKRKPVFGSFVLILLWTSAFIVASPATAQVSELKTNVAGEQIRNFAVDISINKDSTISVKEKIQYDFGFSVRHGIFRDIPSVYPSTSKYDRLIKISNFSAKVDGRPAKVEKKGLPQGPRFQIGDPKQVIYGVHVYELSYEVAGAFNHFKDHEELQWNVTGLGWQYPISDVSAKINAPVSITQINCVSGPKGAQAPCDRESNDGSVATFGHETLYGHEGITVSLGFDVGAIDVARPILREIWSPKRAFALTPATGLGAIAMLLLSVGGVVFVWWRVGRDRAYAGSDIDAAMNVAGEETEVPLFANVETPVQFEPPDKLPPAILAGLMNEEVRSRDISATIVDLAARGYLTIEEIESGLIFKRKDYKFTKLENANDNMAPHEKTILSGIFNLSLGEVKLSDLKGTFADDLKIAKDEIYKTLVAQKYFRHSPKNVKAAFLVAGILLTVLLGVVAIAIIWKTHAGLVALPLPLFGVSFIAMANAMPARTGKGTGIYRRGRGFQRLFTDEEAQRAKFAEDKNIFYKYLPYAIAFGAADKWAKTFGALNAGTGETFSAPIWYVPLASGSFDADNFADSIDHFAVVSSGSLGYSPASSGGSGFGGGGSSGGGFGGGGGGSW